MADIAERISQVIDRTKHEVLALLLAERQAKAEGEIKQSGQAVMPVQEWMTITELASYLRLFNKDGEPTTAGIKSWVRREVNPIPHYYCGDLLRFKPREVDEWMRQETLRRGSGRKRLKAVG